MLPSPLRKTTSFCPKALIACGLPSPKSLIRPRQCQPRANRVGAACASMSRISSASVCDVIEPDLTPPDRTAGPPCSTHQDGPSRVAPPRPTVADVTTHSATIPAGLPVADTIVDLLVVGSGTGMAAALAAHELGLSVLIVEKSSYVGGSTARSGGALWLPAGPVLAEADAGDTAERAGAYLDAVVAGSAPPQRSAAFVAHVSATVEMLRRTTPLRLFWARDYSDYHPEEPGGSAAGRTCECRPFDTSMLGEYRTRLEPGLMEVTVPMPTTGADYRWMNLVARMPRKGIPVFGKRLAQGVGGRAGGPALRRGRSGPDGRAVRGRAARRHPGLDRHNARAPRRRWRPRNRRGRGPRRPRGDDHRAARGGAGHRRLRPQHGHAVEIPVGVVGRQPESGCRRQHRRRHPRGAGIGRRHRSDGSGVVVPRRRAAARQARRR